MKKILITPILWVCFAPHLPAQHKIIFSGLDDVRGHYKQLRDFNPKAKSLNEAIDTLTFPFNPITAEKRLSLKPIYLIGSSPDDFQIPEPPANSSEQTLAELNYLLNLQKERLADDVNSALYKAGVFYNLRITPTDSAYEQNKKNLFYIGRSIGTWFNPDNLPLTADLMAKVWQDASYFIWTFKYKYLRVRPYVLEPALNNLEETNWAAYPSGHAANSYINAYIYRELAPEFSDVFIKDAYDMAHSREIIGVHFPSDSEASRILAQQFVETLFRKEKFLKDFEEVKEEWAKKANENFARPETSSDKSKQKTACAKVCE